MAAITFFLLMVNVAAIFAIDILMWSMIGWQLGVAGLVGIIAFLIAYVVSEEVTLSPRNFFLNSDWGIFCIKLKWAWTMAAIAYAVVYIALAFIGGDILEIL